MDSHDLIHGSGDVKYHLGASSTRTTQDGRQIKLWLASNPSHLEAVSPVVEGVARAKQDQQKQYSQPTVLPVLLHGDAAFSGQGMVAETFNLSQLEGYTTKGTIHIVINNQIGFTTSPADARSSLYATDVAKMVQAPVFHVNGDDPEACIRVTRLALDYRLRFKKDVVIDVVCYRKHGHNEGDDPSYTQPKLYGLIKAKSSTAKLYEDKLKNSGVLSKEEGKGMHDEIKSVLDEAYEKAKNNTEAIEIKADPITLPEFIPPVSKGPQTNVLQKVLNHITETTLTWPEWLEINPKLAKQLTRRNEFRKNPESAKVDWAFAETLAFGSLLLEGYNIRLSGQDSTRGTFSQRHMALFDQNTGKPFIALQHLDETQGTLYVYDSLLSEVAVLGFEFGYSIADPKALVMWEAQFGDFANGAQVIIDQFIASSESKWGQCSGLVLLLPHGYEGQGPEHSSARLERFLQLCANANMQVCNCTTPAQYFHVLRRQVRAGNLKPLVIMTPKSLLRNAMAVSSPMDFSEDKFHNVLDDPQPIKDPRKVVFCSGKVYYDLVKERHEQHITDIALIRLEQLYPYPRKKIQILLDKYRTAKQVVWAQEEPRNMGAWHFISPMLAEQILEHQTLDYAGRDGKSSPAAGRLSIHNKEQLALVRDALS
jgi:2-oxoglutarate dehydrogenase E1 component